MRICHYDDVQFHACNNASVYTKCEPPARAHACSCTVCVNCKKKKEPEFVAIVTDPDE